MSELSFKQISKSYGDLTVVHNFSASVNDQEFLVLLGPSGCGKSTLLRMIAGLSDITSGEFQIDHQRANEWTPHERGIAFVFQSYALYPHMTVRANIAFPLLMERFKPWHHLPLVNSFYRWKLMRDPDIRQATEKMAEQLELTQYLDRRPAALSGGQRQRVALARALVRNPSIYLLDEPLSNLDAKLRTQMRAEISALHKKVQKTFIYVTHDQVEAMTMATRIIIMNKGVIQQVDTPDNIYNDPQNTFVASFIGSPAMNLIPVKIQQQQLHAATDVSWEHPGTTPDASEAVIGIRPEKLTLTTDNDGPLRGVVVAVEKLGAETIIGINLNLHGSNGSLQLDKNIIYVRSFGNSKLEVGDHCSLHYQAEDCYWFHSQTGERLSLNSQAIGKIYPIGPQQKQSVEA